MCRRQTLRWRRILVQKSGFRKDLWICVAVPENSPKTYILPRIHDLMTPCPTSKAPNMRTEYGPPAT